MNLRGRLFPPNNNKKNDIDPIEKELMDNIQEGLAKSSPLEFQEVKMDEGISFAKKVTSLFNPKAISNFAVKSVGFLPTQVYLIRILKFHSLNIHI